MKVVVDRKIYSDECISKLIYDLSSDFIFCRQMIGEQENIEVQEKGDKELNQNDFWDMLNDYKLRDIISKETKDIRTILFAKAFGDFDGLTEDDLQD